MKALLLLTNLAGVALVLLCVLNVVSMIATSADLAGITLMIDLWVMGASVCLAVAGVALCVVWEALKNIIPALGRWAESVL